MRRAALAAGIASSVLMWTPLALADDVNRTGQSQTNDSGKAGTANEGGNADAMGGGNAKAEPQSQQPQQAPLSGSQSPGEAKMNAESNAPQTKH